MNTLSKLSDICHSALQEKQLDKDNRYNKRLAWELSEIDAQDKIDYFIDLYEKKVKFATNENNLLVEFLIGSADQLNVDEFPEFIYGELPDIDIDYLPAIKEYIPGWAILTFGQDRVCAIGSYSTFGIKGTLLDMARVHGLDHKEIGGITKKINLKDEENKTLTWEKALQLYPELKAYCEAHPEVATATAKLLHRNRGMGTHAGGLIISSIDLNNIVPIVRGKDGRYTSAYPEGLHGTDLSPLGLIKFDVLAIKDLLKIVQCCQLVKQRHGLKHIYSLDGQRDWSDTSYLEDPKSLALAATGKLLGVFQFDSKGIRELAKDCQISRFEDIVALTSLYRPGPMGEKMHRTYINRKTGKEAYELHPVLDRILGATFGVMCYQEQVMQILHAVGGIHLKDCEIVRKAISKKDAKKFGKYKEMFVQNGQVVLGWTKEAVEDLWAQIESFAEYGFNKSHAVAYSYITARILTLKAHYPLEFYLTTVKNENDSDTIKTYKGDAEKNGIKFNRLDLNLSKENFTIINDEIYIGFGNVKGIGEEAAKTIVANQPYASFEDFLNKIGTDARVVIPLIALRIFSEPPELLFEFYEHYKSVMSKRNARAKTNKEARLKIFNEICPFLEECSTKIEPTQDAIEELIKTDFEGVAFIADENRNHELIKLFKKYRKSVVTFEEKVAADKPLDITTFEAKGDLDEEQLAVCQNSLEFAESIHYGFGWRHPLQSSPACQHKLFEAFEEDDTLLSASVEVMIIEEPKKIQAKKRENFFYYTVLVEDADWKRNKVTFWSNDYERFKEELTVGNLVRMQVQPPNQKTRNYTFLSYPRYAKLPEKEHDARLLVMEKDSFEQLRR